MTSLLLALSTVLAIVPFAPATTGGWTTYLKPLRYSDLLVRGDTVWCATREAGLLRYSLSERRFSAITRAPSGLASNELSALSYDRSGRLWVGTNGAGASRMSADGSNWLLVNPFDGLPSDSVNCLEAEGDTMWIGTPRGIAFWNGAQIAGSLPVFGQPSPFGSDNVTGVVVRGDTLWLSTHAGAYYGLRSGPTPLRTWTPVVNGLINTQIEALVTNDTLMFCLAGLRIHAYVNGGWQIRNAPGNIYRLFDDDGIVTAVGNSGLWRMTNGGSTQLASDLTGMTNFDLSTLYIPAPIAGDRYVAARATGLIEQPLADQLTGWPEFTPDAPPDNDLRNLNLDGDRVWVNSGEKGVGRLEGSAWRNWPPVTSCPGPSCDTTFYNPVFAWALHVDPAGRKWFGCWESAVDELDDSVDPPVFDHHRVDDALGISAHTRMWASASDSSGGRWFGADTPNLGVIEPIGVEYYSDSLFEGQPTGVTLYRGNIRTTNSALRGNKVHGLTVDKFNNVWIGMTGQGIMTFKVPSDTGFARPFSVPALTLVPGSNSLDVQGLVAYGDTVWALTTHELQRYRRSPLATPVATYNIPEATPLFAANPLAVGPDGSPWVGTEAGMRVFRRNGTSEDFNVRNSPIAGDQIYAIRVHPRTGVVWISTSSGMNRYDPGYRPPPPVQVARLDVTVYPNPISLTRMGVQLRLRGNASAYRGRVLDITGRRIADFDVPASGRVIWDGKDDEGRMVKPGIYLVHVEAGGRTGMARVAVLR